MRCIKLTRKHLRVYITERTLSFLFGHELRSASFVEFFFFLLFLVQVMWDTYNAILVPFSSILHAYDDLPQ